MTLFPLSPGALESFATVALGFAVAGVLATGYQLVARRPASFALLEQAPRGGAFAAMPFLVFAAPFVIMRATLCAPSAGDFRRFQLVMGTTIFASCWSLMSGTAVTMLARPLMSFVAGG